MKRHSCTEASCRGAHLSQMALIPKKERRRRKSWNFSQTSASSGNTKKNNVHTYLEQRLFGDTLYSGNLYCCSVLYLKKRGRVTETKRGRERSYYHCKLRFFGSGTTVDWSSTGGLLKPSNCCLHAASRVESLIPELQCVW